MKPETTPLVGAHDDACPLTTCNALPETASAPAAPRIQDLSAVHMSLAAAPCSEVAKATVDKLIGELRIAKPMSPQALAPYRRALGSALFYLLKAASYSPAKPCYRPMAAGKFSGLPVGYRPFRATLNDLVAAGHIAVVTGMADPSKMSGGDGFTTRIMVQAKLIEWLEPYGLSPSNYEQHFEARADPAKKEAPVKLISTRTKPGKGKRGSSTEMQFDLSEKRVAEILQPVEYLNAYLAKQRIEGAEFNGLVRHFNQGDAADFAWNKGGRLFSPHGGYQIESKEVRAAMNINGEPVVEVDIQASHLTILHALADVEMPVFDDPYGFPDVPRPVAKAWIAITLGNSGFHRRWTDKAKEKYGGELQRDYPIRKIQNLFIERFPLLSDWGSMKIRWGELQFVESEIIMASMMSLAKTWNVPSLPVFDSLIVPKPSKGIAKVVLKNKFYDRLGVYPKFKGDSS